ncbi:MAG: CRISPR-associated endoribonuclease Cas6 [Candidatus Asgardarchaeia archaeon]
MRIRINFIAVNGGILPYNYQYDIHVMIRNVLGTQSEMIPHEYFTYSWLFFPHKWTVKNPNGIKLVPNTRLSLYISSPDSGFIQKLYKILQKTSRVTIGGLALNIHSVLVIDDPKFKEEMRFKTLSPILVTTQIKTEGRTKIWDLAPKDDKFFEQLGENLVSKYTAFYGSPPESNYIRVTKIYWTKSKRIRVKNMFHISHLMSFTIVGHPDILKFAYECGFGEKNHFGFGMVSLDLKKPKAESKEETQKEKEQETSQEQVRELQSDDSSEDKS